jgi:tRNA1Val (adenine37-N6)-methyltransferase
MFHFKKFSIDDSKAAMKIGTDAVLLGAWTPYSSETRILDIGTGSGILALMMAQRNRQTKIDAIEINPDASALAQQNVNLSPWPEQVHIFGTSLQDFSKHKEYIYSLIICNPPFFTGSLKAPDKIRSLARHNDTLPVRELLEITSKLLTENGKAAFIIPADAFEDWITKALKVSLYPAQVTKVRSSVNHSPHRVMVVFSRKENPAIVENELCIYRSKNVYSEEYRELTKDFYLYF